MRDRNLAFNFKLAKTLSALDRPRPLWNPIWLGALPPDAVEDVTKTTVKTEDLFSEVLEVWDSAQSDCFIDRSIDFYVNFYLQDNILVKTDRASMRYGLEARAIFLDNDLVDFIAQIPARFKYRHGRGKRLLHDALSGIVPDWVFDRPKKGFGVPLTAWLRHAPDPLPTHPIPGLHPDAIAALWSAHRARRADHRLPLWIWLSLQYWMENRIASASP